MLMPPACQLKCYRTLDWTNNMKTLIMKRKTTLARCIGNFGGALVLVLSLIAEASAQEQVRINFRDADIRSVIESVAEITGKSFVLDPRVKGKVTIIAPQAIDSSLLYSAVLSAIQVQGFQAVEDGAVTRIVPFNQAFSFAGGIENKVCPGKYASTSTQADAE